MCDPYSLVIIISLQQRCLPKQIQSQFRVTARYRLFGVADTELVDGPMVCRHVSDPGGGVDLPCPIVFELLSSLAFFCEELALRRHINQVGKLELSVQ